MVEGTDKHERILQAVSGDEDALVQLLESAGPAMLVEIDRQIGAPFRAAVEPDDVLQVTCIEAFLRIRSFVPSGSGSFEGWLRRIAANNLQDAIKELERDKRPPPRRRIRPSDPDESYAAFLEELAATTTTPSRICVRAELRESVDRALRRLPTDYERVLRLIELDGLSGSETARRMGKSHGAVRMMAARARERLTEILLADAVVLSSA